MQQRCGFEDFPEIRDREPRLLVVLSLEGCPPCREVRGHFDAVAQGLDLGGRALELKLEPVKERAHRAFIRSLEVKGFPTILLFEDGDCVWSRAGAISDRAWLEIFAWLGDLDRPFLLPGRRESAPAEKRV